MSRIFTRSIPVQWIQGSQEVAEVSFFKINSQGTPLDKTEALILKNRKKSFAVAARSIVRAGVVINIGVTFQKKHKEALKFIQKRFLNFFFNQI